MNTEVAVALPAVTYTCPAGAFAYDLRQDGNFKCAVPGVGQVATIRAPIDWSVVPVAILDTAMLALLLIIIARLWRRSAPTVKAESNG